jgi:hypothetical protein
MRQACQRRPGILALQMQVQLQMQMQMQMQVQMQLQVHELRWGNTRPRRKNAHWTRATDDGAADEQ